MKINDEKPWQTSKGQQAVEDVILAKGFIRDIGGPGKVVSIISQAADRLREYFPHFREPKKQWTERRLWEWWNGQSELVRHWQMMEMYQAAERAKEERLLIAEARRKHAEFIAKTTHLAEFLERQDSSFHRPQIEALRSMGGGVRGPGTQGE